MTAIAMLRLSICLQWNNRRAVQQNAVVALMPLTLSHRWYTTLDGPRWNFTCRQVRMPDHHCDLSAGWDVIDRKRISVRGSTTEAELDIDRFSVVWRLRRANLNLFTEFEAFFGYYQCVKLKWRLITVLWPNFGLFYHIILQWLTISIYRYDNRPFSSSVQAAPINIVFHTTATFYLGNTPRRMRLTSSNLTIDSPWKCSYIKIH